jgi:acyl-CoA thioesterase
MNVKEINDNYKKINGFDYVNGIVIDEVSKDIVKAHVSANEKSYNPWEIVHGGLIFGLADTAIGVLCYANDQKGITIDANINYLKPCKKEARVEARIVKIGKTIGVYQAIVYNEDGELSAIMTSNYFNAK